MKKEKRKERKKERGEQDLPQFCKFCGKKLNVREIECTDKDYDPYTGGQLRRGDIIRISACSKIVLLFNIPLFHKLHPWYMHRWSIKEEKWSWIDYWSNDYFP